MSIKKPPEWSANIVGLMHLNKISVSKLADHIGWRREYVSRLLNGSEERNNAKDILLKGIKEIVAKETSAP